MRDQGLPLVVLGQPCQVCLLKARAFQARRHDSLRHLHIMVLQIGPGVTLAGRAVRRVLAGTGYMSPRLEQRFAAKFPGARTVEDDSPLAVLTDRELEVYRLIGHGETTRAIAERLGLSVKTIESHRERLQHKLTLATAAALVRSATRWVDAGEVG